MIWLKGAGMTIVVALVGLFGYGLTRDASLIPSPLVGQPAPDFRLERLEAADSVALTDLRGKAVVINFWASWCLACKQEHPSLVRAWERYRDQGVELVGVVYQDTRANASAYLEKHGGGWIQLMDPKTRTAIDYGVYGIPETFFIDRSGVITHKHIGPVDDHVLRIEVERLLRPTRTEPAEPTEEAS